MGVIDPTGPFSPALYLYRGYHGGYHGRGGCGYGPRGRGGLHLDRPAGGLPYGGLRLPGGHEQGRGRNLLAVLTKYAN